MTDAPPQVVSEAQAEQAAGHPQGLWVFGYGSLMWRPGFAYDRAVRARVVGYHRALCLYSMHHRGNQQRPGMVLGLDRGGACEGMAFHVAPDDIAATRAYLTAREQVSGVYRETLLPVTLLDAARAEVMALAYTVERAHPSYAGALPLAVQARLLRGARGISGNNLDYVFSTLAHLRELGIRERALERLIPIVGPHLSRDSASGRPSPRVAALRAACWRVRVPAPRLSLYQRSRFTHRKHMAHRVI